MFLSAIGGIASGIGSIASGFGLGGNSKSTNIFMARKNHEINQEYQERWMKRLPHIAKKTRLHPLSLIGQNPVGSSVSFSGNNNAPDLASIGQGIDRALNAGRSKVDRQLDELAIEKAKLSNDYLRTQIAGSVQRLNSNAQNPSLPSPSDGNIIEGQNADNIRVVASESVSHKKGDKGQEAGSSPMWKKFYLDNDTYIKLPPGQSIDELGFPMSMLKSGELAYKNYQKYTPGYWLAKKWKNYNKSRSPRK